jgi:hypothetical protein
MQTDPSFTDGKAAIGEPILECLNLTGDGTTYQRYEYLSDNIDREAIIKKHADADGSPLGSDTREGFEEGSINLQLSKANHSIARPGHIIHLDIGNGSEYYLAGKFGRARTRREVVKGALAVTRAYNPIIASLLSSAYGQMKKLTQAEGALAAPISTAPTVVNTRTGSTLAYSLAARPGYSVPSWLSINSGTGALSGTAEAGHWELEVICTETLTGEETRIGFGILDLTITA